MNSKLIAIRGVKRKKSPFWFSQQSHEGSREEALFCGVFSNYVVTLLISTKSSGRRVWPMVSVRKREFLSSAHPVP